MDGSNVRQSFLEAFCGQLGEAAGSLVSKVAGAVNPALGAALGSAVTVGVAECCNRGSLDTCAGKSPPPPPAPSFGGAGAGGGW